MSLEIAIKELREKVKNSELELKEIHRLCAESVNDRLFRLKSLVDDIDEYLKKECSENDIDVCISSPGYLNLSRCDETNYKSLNYDLMNLKHIYWKLSTGLVTLDVWLYTSFNENEYFLKIYADNVDTYEIFNDVKKIYKQSRIYNTYTSSTYTDALQYNWNNYKIGTEIGTKRGTKIGEQCKEYSYKEIAQESVFEILKRHLFEFETRKKETYNPSITFSNTDTGILGSNNLTISSKPIVHGTITNCNTLTISACPTVGCNSNDLTIRSNPIFHGKPSLTISDKPVVGCDYNCNKRELSINEAFRSRVVSLDEDKWR